MLLSELCDLYLLNRPCLSGGSIYLMGRACRSLEEFAGNSLRVNELSKDVVLRWIRHRLTQVSPKTVKRERGDILTLWRFAWGEGLHNVNPDTLRIPTIKVNRRLPTAWRLSEMSAWLRAAGKLRGTIGDTGISKAIWWQSFGLLLYDTGARPWAAIRIETADLDMANSYVILRASNAKTGIEQVCGLSDQTINAIAEHYDRERKMLFPWPYHRRTLWDQYQAITELAGLAYDRYHSLGCMRRTAASYAAACGSTAMAARLLGHTTTATTTKHYIDPRIAQRASAVQVLPRPTI